MAKHQARALELMGGATVSAGEVPDSALLARVADPEEAALTALYGRYGNLIFTLALRLVGERPLAEEVMQDTFLRCWDRVETYHPEAGTPVAWLKGIARNRAIDLCSQ